MQKLYKYPKSVSAGVTCSLIGENGRNNNHEHGI
jgi:hypothetical protein